MRWIPLFFPLVGCNLIDQLKDKIEPYTETVVIQALTIGVAEPDHEELAAALAEVDDWSPGVARATMFAANAASVTDLENAPIQGASASVRSDALGKIVLSEVEPGKYVSDGFDYPHGDEVSILMDDGEDHGASTLAASGLTRLAIEPTHAANRDLTIDASGESVDALLIIVVDAGTGRVVHDSTPQDIQEMYEFTHGSGSLTATVPGSVFDHDALYGVGVVGLKRASEGTYEGINALLSTFMAGEAVFYPVTVSDAGG